MFHFIPSHQVASPFEVQHRRDVGPSTLHRHAAYPDHHFDLDSYADYDDYRSQQELQALIEQQLQRRQREAAQLLAAQRRREQEEAEQRAYQEALLRARYEAQIKAQVEAELRQKAILERQRQLQAQQEAERRQRILAAQQQQQQQQACARPRRTINSGTEQRRRPACARSTASFGEHPFAPFFRVLFDAEPESEQDEVTSETPEPEKKPKEEKVEPQSAEDSKKSAPVESPPQPAQGRSVEDNSEQTLEDVLGSMFKQLFGFNVDIEKRERKTSKSNADKPVVAPTSTPADDPAEVPVAAPKEHKSDKEQQQESSAAETLQRHYRTHLNRRKALATLSSLSSQFEARRSSFVLPESLTFQPSPPASEHEASDSTAAAPAPKLAYQPSNAPFLAYEDFLVSLLSKVDEVSSGGDRTIKTARKDLVRKIEEELGRLDSVRDEAWKKQQVEHDDKEETESVEPLLPESTENKDEHVGETDVTEAPAEDDSKTAVEDETPAPETHDDPEEVPAPSPVRLTPEALAKLASPALRRVRADDDDSASSSTTTLSDRTLDVEEAIGHILKQAKILGDQVQRMEHAEV